MNIIQLVIFLLASALFWSNSHSQAVYDQCDNALELCPNQIYSVNNIGATSTVCPNCEDDFTFCFTSDNSIWLSFTTNASGGDVTASLSNLVFEINAGQDAELQATILETLVPCDASTYTQLGNCESNVTGNFALTAPGLVPLTTYYIVIDGDMNGGGVTQPAECTFDISVSGPGIDRTASSISVTPSTTTACLGENVSFTAVVTDCPDTTDYEWYIDGNLVATTTDPVFQTSALTQGSVLTVQTNCYSICPETVVATSPNIDVYSFPIDAGPDQQVAPGESVVLGGSTTAPVYSWSPSFLLSDASNLNPIANPTESTIFTLSATQNGCTLTDQCLIEVGTFLDIPNAFSPNNDGNNEEWIILGIEEFPNAYVTVLSRWGQVVFETVGYSSVSAWDGTGKRGEELSSGVYYYTIELRDEANQTFSGYLTLMR